MNKHKHIIVLNGRHYNAKTGESLSHPSQIAHAPKASHHAPVHKPAAAAPRKAARTAARQPGRHVHPHTPKPARTLMRQAVKKPSASVKRRIRVQAHLDTQIKQPAIAAPVRSHPLKHRVTKGKKVHLISHFSPNLFAVTTVVTTSSPKQSLISDRPIVNNDVTPRPTMRAAFAPKKPRTTAELLEYAIRFADSPPEPEEQVRRKHGRRKPAHRRAHAVAH